MNRISLIIFPAILFIFSTSCTHGWKTYVVKKGHHSTNDVNPVSFNMDRISFDFIADSSWYYDLPDNSGWSKIRGISDGHHQENSSARLVWRCIGDSLLQVGAYCYVDGMSPQDDPNLKAVLDTIVPGITYHCSIARRSDRYYIDFEDKSWDGPAGRDLSWGYLLNPYIGGSYTFDHDWKIRIRDK